MSLVFGRFYVMDVEDEGVEVVVVESVFLEF